MTRRKPPRPAHPASQTPGQPSGHAAGQPGRRHKPGGAQSGRPGLLFGLHPVAAAWTNPDRRCTRLLATEAGLASLAGALDQARAAGLERPKPSVVERTELDRLLPPGAVHQGLVLDAAPLPEVDLEDIVRQGSMKESDVIVVLDQVTDPHNVGAILRSAAAFGASAVVLPDRNAPELTGTLAKSASGAAEVVPLVRIVNLARSLTELREAGYWCVGLDESGARTLARMDLKGRVALVLGAEGSGLRRLTMERCDEIARLPTGGPIGSLNVSNAAAVALYELARLR
ncbi:23S rRNA (guanosine(2251)-2'-O)-methyltransferase RlmB [Skermanella rosea]|uniref:23S rRNA (guanosine(2251)-2'-O)-methyltransferase RlmB n=1 Tax=Skermanella rosea TaxID=1817965 RepID=UPI00193447F4|nr:23S rRNA (guanosine(2251)-2'-O)-methyltransferase RlmB [Skermanella rosea]UEM02036.1 23S rRNA (guanosine(2251)-2'-O)-methyltransferase RlmB [Skermanella rosea]